MQWLALKNYSVNTIQQYQRHLQQFVGYMQQRLIHNIQIVSIDNMDGFMNALLKGEGNKPRTVAAKLESVRALYRFAELQGLVPEKNVATRSVAPRWHHTPVIAPEADVILRVLSVIPDKKSLDIRDRAIFRMMYVGALRVSPLCSLDIYDSEKPPKYCLHPEGVVYYRNKGGATKSSVVDEETMRLVDEWLQVRKKHALNPDEKALFITRRGTRCNRSQLHSRIKGWGEKAGIPSIHCHLLRHRRLGDLRDKLGLEAAHKQSGHSSMTTTNDIYGHHPDQLVRDRIRHHCPVPVPGEDG